LREANGDDSKTISGLRMQITDIVLGRLKQQQRVEKDGSKPVHVISFLRTKSSNRS